MLLLSIHKNYLQKVIQKQIDLMNPNVLIFGNTIELYKNMLELDFSKFQNSGSCKYIIQNNKLYISAYHPSQRTITRDKYVNDVIIVVENWSNNLK
jgi:hypothetical protein